MSSAWAIVIMCAGTGQRFGADVPKQYAPLGGRTVLEWSLEAFENMGPCVLVADPAHAPFYTPILARFPGVTVVPGGATRQQSVQNGLNALADHPPRYVMVHDAARPLVDAASIARIKTAIEAGARAATLAVPVVDTLLRGTQLVDRTGIHAVQTPQAFEYTLLHTAHNETDGQFTDDATLVHAQCGVTPAIVQGHADNFKITTPDDLMRAQKTLPPQTRTGLGFDVHRFGPHPEGQTTVRLCGVDMPSPMALMGHSDADAGLHAIADAILGTIGAGDIGVHFPPTDPQWKGMDSALIVEKALALLHARGGTLVNVDVMLMAEFPRITPHRDAMSARLCALLGLPADAVGLKATTAEKMGFVGRGEGVAVQAIATVSLPA